MAEISVVIPTKDRLPYLRKAVPMFLAEAEVKEVVIVVDGCTDGTLEYVRTASESDPRIRYVRLADPLVLGDKRNVACELSRGEIVAHWDDDDWYAPDRVSWSTSLMW